MMGKTSGIHQSDVFKSVVSTQWILASFVYYYMDLLTLVRVELAHTEPVVFSLKNLAIRFRDSPVNTASYLSRVVNFQEQWRSHLTTKVRKGLECWPAERWEERGGSQCCQKIPGYSDPSHFSVVVYEKPCIQKSYISCFHYLLN